MGNNYGKSYKSKFQEMKDTLFNNASGGLTDSSITENVGFNQFKRDMLNLGFGNLINRAQLDAAGQDAADSPQRKKRIEIGNFFEDSQAVDDFTDKVVQTRVKKLKKAVGKEINMLPGTTGNAGVADPGEGDDQAQIEKQNKQIANLEDRLKILYETFNLMSYTDNLPQKITRFVDTIMPREFYSKEISELLRNWSPTVEVLFECHDFSLKHTIRDKDYIYKYMTDREVYLLGNPVTSVFVNLYTFVNPPIVRLGYLSICMSSHILLNVMAMGYFITPPIDRDNKVFYVYDSSYIFLTISAGLIAIGMNFILAFFIFTKDSIFIYPKSIEELFGLKELVLTQRRLSGFITALLSAVFLSLSYILAVRLTFSHG